MSKIIELAKAYAFTKAPFGGNPAEAYKALQAEVTRVEAELAALKAEKLELENQKPVAQLYPAHFQANPDGASKAWGDTPDEWSEAIDASHPMRTGAHDAYATAMEMVGNRKSKGSLVELVCWLLQRPTPRRLTDEEIMDVWHRYNPSKDWSHLGLIRAAQAKIFRDKP